MPAVYKNYCYGSVQDIVTKIKQEFDPAMFDFGVLADVSIPTGSYIRFQINSTSGSGNFDSYPPSCTTVGPIGDPPAGSGEEINYTDVIDFSWSIAGVLLAVFLINQYRTAIKSR